MKKIRFKRLLVLVVAFMTFTCCIPLMGGGNVMAAKKPTYKVTAKQTKTYNKMYMKTNEYKKKKYTRQYYVLRSYLEAIEKKGGGTLKLGKGTYTIVKRLHIPSNCRIVLADGVKIKFVYKKGVSSYGPIAELVTKKDLENKKFKGYKGYKGVHDVTIEGPAKGSAVIDKQYVDGTALTIAHAKNVTIKNVTFQNIMAKSHFLEIDAAQNVSITGCKFQNAKNWTDMVKGAINLDTPDKKTKGFSSKYTSYDRTPNKNVRIENNTFTKVPVAVETHLYSEGRPHDKVTIKNNRISSYYYGIRAMNWTSPVITNNTITVNAGALGAGKNRCGMILQGVTDPTVTDNTIIMKYLENDDADHVYCMKVESAYLNGSLSNVYGEVLNQISDEQLEALRANTFVWDSENAPNAMFGGYFRIRERLGTSNWTDVYLNSVDPTAGGNDQE